MKVLKKNAGITIVSLIITIVIMLMLAGASIFTIRNTGLFDKAEKATIEDIKATSAEKIKLALTSLQEGAAEENKSVTLQLIHDGLPKEDNKISMYAYYNTDKSVSGVYEYDKKHEYEFTIDGNGNVILGKVAELNRFKINTSNVTSKSVDVSIENALSKGIEGANYTYVAQTSDGEQVKVSDTKDKSKTIYGLKAGTKYNVYVLAELSNGKVYKSTVENIETEGLPDVKLVKGAIDFSGITWNDKKASITISTDTNYTIQYQINGINGNWTSASKAGESITVPELVHNDVVYARLTDGYNNTGYTSTVIKDSIAPTVTLTQKSVSTRAVTVTAGATDNAGMPSSPTYTFYIKKTSDSSYPSSSAQSGTNASFTKNDLAANTSYTIKVETTDLVGNLGSKELSITTGAMPTGAITMSTSNGNNWTNQNVTVTATTSKSGFTMQMQIGSGDWQNTSSVTISSNCTVNARLTDGKNYTGTASITESKIDKTGPANVTLTQGTITADSIAVTASATDAESGIASYTFYVNGEQKQSGVNSAFNATLLAASTSYTIKMEVKNGAGAVETKSITATTKAYRAPYIYNTQYLGKVTDSSGYWRTYTKNYTGWAWVIKAQENGCGMYGLIIHASDRYSSCGNVYTNSKSDGAWNNSCDVAFNYDGQGYYMSWINSDVRLGYWSDGLSGIPTLTWNGSDKGAAGQSFMKYILWH